MDINLKLLETIRPYCYNYKVTDYEVQRFLSIAPNKILERQKEATSLIQDILSDHGKNDLLRYISQLAKVENETIYSQSHLRDHVVHAFLTFLLGIYVNEEFIRPQIGFSVDTFQWQLAALMHDVGYPPELSSRMTINYTNTARESRTRYKIFRKIGFRQVPFGFQSLTRRRNAFVLIQKCIDKWGLQIDAKHEYTRMIRSGYILHGIMSSLTILNHVDDLYDSNNRLHVYEDVYSSGTRINWNQRCFDEDIVPACAAIFVHNLPADCFNEKKIRLSKAPLAFLLNLCDALQQWERPSQDNPSGFDSSSFDIELADDHLIFKAEMSDNDKEGIRKEIKQYLSRPKVTVV